MKIQLFRKLLGDTFTRGVMYINGRFECWTLEDTDRRLEENPDVKIEGETCIPRGTYKVIITYSNRFKRELPLLVDVPGFSGVRIHPGNTAADTHGCVLVGLAVDNDDSRVNMSHITFDALWKQIEAAFDKGEDITLEIE